MTKGIIAEQSSEKREDSRLVLDKILDIINNN